MTKDDMKIIKSFAEDICANFLLIKVPAIRYERHHKMTATMKMMTRISGGEACVYIDPQNRVNVEMAFGLAHELRHIHQHEHHTFNLDDYMGAEILNKDKYNTQWPEVDAHAFGAFIALRMFGSKMMFNGFSQNLKEKIWQREREIEEEMLKRGITWAT